MPGATVLSIGTLGTVAAIVAVGLVLAGRRPVRRLRTCAHRQGPDFGGNPLELRQDRGRAVDLAQRDEAAALQLERGHAFEAVVRAVNATGFALTFGVHSRIDETIERATALSAAGNQYVNRTVIGAVVGVQPFGVSR